MGSVGYWTSKSRSSVDGCINESWSSREKLGLQTHMGRHQLIVCIESHRTGCRKYYCILLENRTKVKKEWYLLWAVNSLSLVFPTKQHLLSSSRLKKPSMMDQTPHTRTTTKRSYLTGIESGTRKMGLPRWLSGKESACQCSRLRRRGFDPWVGKIP